MIVILIEFFKLQWEKIVKWHDDSDWGVGDYTFLSLILMVPASILFSAGISKNITFLKYLGITFAIPIVIIIIYAIYKGITGLFNYIKRDVKIAAERTAHATLQEKVKMLKKK